MNNELTISGFTIVRNAEKLHYPLRESVLSALPFCKEFIINCGDSEDNTSAICETLKNQFPDKIKIIYTQWTRENQTGGFQLKHQTDTAIKACVNPWCLYIQADEVFHEEDFDKVLKAQRIAAADDKIDGVLFTYLHFYGSYDYFMKGRNWYRKEVRLFKNGRSIEAFRDAQGFRKNGERISAVKSDAQVFHYGYVRTPDSLSVKSKEMSRWWGTETNDEDYTLYRHVGLRKFKATHPAVMHKKMTEHPSTFHPENCHRKWDRNEIKNAITLLWESIFNYRIGEYRNYEEV